MHKVMVVNDYLSLSKLNEHLEGKAIDSMGYRDNKKWNVVTITPLRVSNENRSAVSPFVAVIERE